MTRRYFIKWLLLAAAVMGGIYLSFTTWWQRKLGEIVIKPKPKIEPTAENAPGGPALSFFLLSDLHVTADEPHPSRHLQRALEDVMTIPTDTIILGGDLTDFGRKRDYDELKGILDKFDLPPLYANMGNHDYYDIWIDEKGSFNEKAMPNGKTDAQSRERFQQFMGVDKPYHDAWIKGYHFIMVSQECYVQEKPEVGEGAWYSDEQLEWLKGLLSQHKDNQPVFIMIHQPLPPAGQDGRPHQLIRAKAFREILKPYPNIFVFSGHQHRDFRFPQDHYVKETFHWFANSSVGRVLNRQFKQEYPDSAQGLYVQVWGNRAVLRGREFSNRTWVDQAEWTVELMV
ncbi:MAG TPA: metallophosphoesterase [Bacillota bacterium]|nr:metallophosphoesterase [Bacillota bacterium]